MNRLNKSLLSSVQNGLFLQSLQRSLSVETAAYTSTRGNLMIDSNTKVICQGFTGKQVT
jgi:hypothetical protein